MIFAPSGSTAGTAKECCRMKSSSSVTLAENTSTTFRRDMLNEVGVRIEEIRWVEDLRMLALVWSLLVDTCLPPQVASTAIRPITITLRGMLSIVLLLHDSGIGALTLTLLSRQVAQAVVTCFRRFPCVGRDILRPLILSRSESIFWGLGMSVSESLQRRYRYQHDMLDPNVQAGQVSMR